MAPATVPDEVLVKVSTEGLRPLAAAFTLLNLVSLDGFCERLLLRLAESKEHHFYLLHPTIIDAGWQAHTDYNLQRQSASKWRICSGHVRERNATDSLRSAVD
jgi:hypothetical protein